MIGKIDRVPLREVWRHEALDFTRWLEQNIEVLNDLLDINLLNARREQGAGSFSVDLVAEDANGNPVVIENQLEKSNHDHLGKLITYLTAFGAHTAIWIVSDPRPEHTNAIAWLNQATDASFYLVKLEAIRIGESQPAPLLTLIVGPGETSQITGLIKKEIVDRQKRRKEFWGALLTYAQTKTRLHTGVSPKTGHWIGTGAGIGGLVFNYVLLANASAVELYIDRGEKFREETKEIFGRLAAKKGEIESAFGGPLEWQRLDDRRACRVVCRFSHDGWEDNASKWPAIYELMVDAMIRLERALRPHIEELKTQ